MRAQFGKWGPRHDYRGAHVLDANARLATIIDIYRCDVRNVTMARLRRFNGDDAGEQALATLELLERDYDYSGDDAGEHAPVTRDMLERDHASLANRDSAPDCWPFDEDE